VELVGRKRRGESAPEEIKVRRHFGNMNDLNRQRFCQRRVQKPDRQLRSFLESLLENQANPARGDVDNPGGSPELFAGRADLANRFEPARVAGAIAAFRAGGPGRFLGASSDSLRNG
jgi:hypothetical protein